MKSDQNDSIAQDLRTGILAFLNSAVDVFGVKKAEPSSLRALWTTLFAVYSHYEFMHGREPTAATFCEEARELFESSVAEGSLDRCRAHVAEFKNGEN